MCDCKPLKASCSSKHKMRAAQALFLRPLSCSVYNGKEHRGLCSCFSTLLASPCCCCCFGRCSLPSCHAADGYDVDYLRIPVTDEKAPKDQDFEQLIQRLWGVPLDAALIFNCQVRFDTGSGRGKEMCLDSMLDLLSAASLTSSFS